MLKRSIFLLLLLLGIFQGQAQVLSTIAGNGTIGSGGDNGLATSASFSVFSILSIDKENNLYVADVGNHKIRKIDLSTNIITTYGGSGVSGFSGDGSLALTAQFDNPTFVTLNSNGDLFVTDGNNHRIRKIEKSTGIITTVAGNGSITFVADGVPAVTAPIAPLGICFDKNDNLIINDNGNHRIRKVDVNGVITTICGTGVNGFSGDGGLALSADIGGVSGICVDDSNNIYFACTNQARVRKIASSTGIIITFAGNGSVGFSGDGGQATSASLNWPFSVTADSGNVYIADQVNNRIRKVNAQGIISTIAGNGVTGFGGDGGIADTATFNRPSSVAFDTCSNMYIADKMNKRVRKVTYDTCYPASINEVVAGQFNIYPNPANTQITITSNSKLKEAYISNTIGQVVLQQNISKEKAELDIAQLQPGIYFVTVTNASGVKLTKKIVKE